MATCLFIWAPTINAATQADNCVKADSENTTNLQITEMITGDSPVATSFAGDLIFEIAPVRIYAIEIGYDPHAPSIDVVHQPLALVLTDGNMGQIHAAQWGHNSFSGRLSDSGDTNAIALVWQQPVTQGGKLTAETGAIRAVFDNTSEENEVLEDSNFMVAMIIRGRLLSADSSKTTFVQGPAEIHRAPNLQEVLQRSIAETFVAIGMFGVPVGWEADAVTKVCTT
jgi:hypothetical protein